MSILYLFTAFLKFNGKLIGRPRTNDTVDSELSRPQGLAEIFLEIPILAIRFVPFNGCLPHDGITPIW